MSCLLPPGLAVERRAALLAHLLLLPTLTPAAAAAWPSPAPSLAAPAPRTPHLLLLARVGVCQDRQCDDEHAAH